MGSRDDDMKANSTQAGGNGGAPPPQALQLFVPGGTFIMPPHGVPWKEASPRAARHRWPATARGVSPRASPIGEAEDRGGDHGGEEAE